VLPAAAATAPVPSGPVGHALLRRLSSSIGNRSVGALIHHQGRTRSRVVQRVGAPAPSVAPAETPQAPEQRVTVALTRTPPDFKRAFNVLNGLSLAHMLATLVKLKASSQFDKLRAAVSELASAGVFAERIELAMDAVASDPSLSVAEFEITHGHTLAKVEPEGRDAVLAFVDPRYPTLKRLRESAGFKALAADEAIRFMTYVGGRSREISLPAFAAFDQALAGGKLDLSKVESLRKFFKDQAGAPGVVAPEAGAFEGKRDTYSVGAPTEVKKYKFQSKTVDALRHDVTIGNADKTVVPVYEPKTPDPKVGKMHSIDAVAKGLAALPKSSLKLVTKVHLEPGRNPDDPYWAKKYKRPGFFSYMTAGKAGVITIYPTPSLESQEYLEGTMIHETGHTLTGQKWGEDTDKRWKPWKEAMKSDVVVASQYAKASPGEDFAETLQAYFQVKGTRQEQELRVLMPARMKIIDDLLAEKKP
jgi:hypothetical protein